MATDSTDRSFHDLRRAEIGRGGTDRTDAQLLESFIEQRDEAALESVVRRHGPMVLGVCRRLLHDPHDAEDAFQATFLVLVRKAATVRPREMLANWLYGVARQTAIRARTANARRRGRERLVERMPEPEAGPRADCDDLRALLDQELSRLPDKYRIPIILCDLEDKTRREAVRQLGWPEGSVSSRLARARAMLAKRLTRHAVALSSGSLGVLLAGNTASSAVPAPLVASTVNAACRFAAGQAVTSVISFEVAALTKGVLKAMLASKMKAAMVVILAAALCGVTALFAYHAAAAGVPAGDPEPVAKSPEKKPKKARGDREKLQGTWTTVSSTRDGVPAPKVAADLQPQVIIKADKYVIEYANGIVRLPTTEMSFEVDPSKSPKEIDFTPTAGANKGKTIPAIYSLKGDDLEICFGAVGGKRPTKFESGAKAGKILVVLKRKGT